MKDYIRIIVHIIFILGGVILTIWSIFEWSKIGFNFNFRIYERNVEGNSYFIVAAIGLAMVFHGVTTLLIIRHSKIKENENME